MKKVFISRQQTQASVFRKALTDKGFEVHGESLIEISAAPFSSFPEVDWIFFYSKNGVKHFFEQLENPLSLPPKFATIGPGTADYMEEHFAHPSFVGDGHAENTAKLFLEKAKGGKVLFPRAKTSERSVQKWLGNGVTAIDLVVYENSPKKDFELPDFDCLVFTSPMNATTYFTKKKYRENQQVVAIGNATASTLNDLGIKNVIIADKPTEPSLVAAILKIK